jgi:aminoglycoside phosphotransferase (APT) family kinase protein
VWQELPEALRSAVTVELGSAVSASESRAGGWSPGSADRLLLADGRRVFVKAASAEVNEATVAMHRREASVLAALDGLGIAPSPLGAVESGPWFALIVEDLPGRHPDPSDPADTAAVLDAVAALPDPVPSSVPPAEADARTELAEGADDWHRLLEEGGAGTVPGAEATVRAMAAVAAGAGDAVDGTGLVHLDLRIDNVLVLPNGSARIVDWPNAVRGAAWFDALTYLLDVRRFGGQVDPAAHPVTAGVPAELVDAAAAGLAGYFFRAALRPEPPAMAGIRAFQHLQGEVVLAWLLERRPDLR